MKCKNKKALSAEDRLDLITTVENKPDAVVLFAGGGGVECGMIDAGIEPVLAVEYDPGKPELSKAITDSHEANFPRCKVLRRTVSDGHHQYVPTSALPKTGRNRLVMLFQLRQLSPRSPPCDPNIFS